MPACGRTSARKVSLESPQMVGLIIFTLFLSDIFPFNPEVGITVCCFSIHVRELNRFYFRFIQYRCKLGLNKNPGHF